MAAFRCVIIGESSLPLACANVVLREGHSIAGMVSPDQNVLHWAANNGIAHSDHAQLSAFLERLDFDYLFSIVNYKVLTGDVLSRPRRMAINYHDALLPRYAGIHATSWAILNREPVHGITWHVMTREVDVGDVLKQVEIPLESEETAASLNLSCYYASVSSFAELVEELAEGREKPTPQALRQRTYYSLHQKPPRGGVVEWDADAETVDAFIRSMDFGDYKNSFAVPKIEVGDCLLLVLGSRIAENASTKPPGTVVSLGECSIVVATQTRDVAIERVLSPFGNPSSQGIEVGMSLKSCTVDGLGQLYSAASRHEKYWIKQLSSLKWYQGEGGSDLQSVLREAFIELGQEYLHIGLKADHAFRPPHFASIVPLRLFAGCDVDSEATQVARRTSFPFDLFQRSPALRGMGYQPGKLVFQW